MGMQLPNLKNAQVEKRKITAYLLSENNSGGKQEFFAAFGFSLSQWEVLRDALLDHATVHETSYVSETEHGMKYLIEGAIQAPDGRFPWVRAVWIVDAGKDTPRFVIAYPLEGKNR